MSDLNTIEKISDTAPRPVIREYDIGGRGFVVKSIFVGDKDVKATLLNLAEKKAIEEMGFDFIAP